MKEETKQLIKEFLVLAFEQGVRKGRKLGVRERITKGLSEKETKHMYNAIVSEIERDLNK